MHKILFIGLGTMGYPMAGYLSKSNEVTVFNRSLNKSEKWMTDYQGSFITDLSKIESDFDFIISCVGNDNDLKEITISESGCFKKVKTKTIFIDHSTISPSLAVQINIEANKKNITFLDAPISGGQSGAENGSLSIMVGGDKDAFEKSLTIFNSYGKKIMHMGGSGSGQYTKIINQICIAGLVQGLSEAVYFMKQTDLNPKDVLDVISSGAAQSWQLDNRFLTMVEGKYDFGFSVDLMRKDLSIAMKEAAGYGIDLEVTEIVDKFYSEIQQIGGNKLDTSSLLKRLIS